jgi:hypothetical protein
MLVDVAFNKKDTPLPDGETTFVGCIKCDELLNSKIEGRYEFSYCETKSNIHSSAFQL